MLPSGRIFFARFSSLSLSDTGHLAYRSGATIGLVGKPDLFRNPALSPDEARLAVERMDDARRQRDIWIFDLARNVLSRLTSNDRPAAGDLVAVAVDRRATPPLGATVVVFRERLLNGPTVVVGFAPQSAVSDRDCKAA
jgi:hypothetical protein